MSDSELTMGSAGHGALLEETPYGMQSKKLAMWLFIASDAVTFTVALVAYGYLADRQPGLDAAVQFLAQHRQRTGDDVRAALQ